MADIALEHITKRYPDVETSRLERNFRSSRGVVDLARNVIEHNNPGRLEKAMGKQLGDPADPLLVSVRSGAKFSMPGMMDTVLNLGLNDESVEGLAKQTSDERFACDSYRRFIQMYGRIVQGIEGGGVGERGGGQPAQRGIGIAEGVECGGPNRQRPHAHRGRRAGDAPAVRAAQRSRPEWPEVWLWPVPVRGL